MWSRRKKKHQRCVCRTGFGKYLHCLCVLRLSGNKTRMSAVCVLLLEHQLSFFSFVSLLYKGRSLVLVKGSIWGLLSRVHQWKEWGTQQAGAPVLFTFMCWTFCIYPNVSCGNMQAVMCSLCCWGMCQVWLFGCSWWLVFVRIQASFWCQSNMLIFDLQKFTAAELAAWNSAFLEWLLLPWNAIHSLNTRKLENSPHFSFRSSCFSLVKTFFFLFIIIVFFCRLRS